MKQTTRNTSQRPDKHVNHLLHTLRGEQFRRSQNLLKSKAHLSSSFARNKPTLPIDLAVLDYDTFGSQPSNQGTQSASDQTCSGPVPPKSWRRNRAQQDIYNTVSWRSQALSLLYSELGATVDEPRVPPLSLMCLTHLITSYSVTELREDILPFVPQHLRQSLVRYTSIHSPLPNSRLFALYEAESHANGEIIVIGPNNSIRDDYFIQASAASTEGPSTSTSRSSPSPTPSIEDDWEAEDTSPALLRVVAIASTHLSTSTVLSLPPTITHLALIHLPTPIPLHRLPFVCPLLVFLDLSFNTWLQDPPEETLKSWDRVYWGRWSQLKVLGLRGCDMSPDRLEKVNEGRWDDVRIVRE